MSEEEENYNHGFSSWEMVTGEVGTFMRAIDVIHDLGDWFGEPDIKPDQFMRSWYYDNAVPSGNGDNGSPEHPNKWSMCTGNLDDQVCKLGLLLIVFSACGGIRTGHSMPILTAYFAVMA